MLDMRPASILLVEWRKKLDLTQRAAADTLGVPAPVLCDWEAGKKCARVETAIKVAEITDGAVPVESWRSPTKGELVQLRRLKKTA